MKSTCIDEYPKLMGDAPCPKWNVRELQEKVKQQLDAQLTVFEKCPCGSGTDFKVVVTPVLKPQRGASFFYRQNVSKIERLDFDILRDCGHHSKFSIGF